MAFAAVATAAAVMALGSPLTQREGAWERQWRLLRMGRLLGGAFLEFTRFGEEWRATGQRDDHEGDDPCAADRAMRRLRWWAAIKRAQQTQAATNATTESPSDQSNSGPGIEDVMVNVLIELLLGDDTADGKNDPEHQHELVRCLLERGALEIVVEYIANTKAGPVGHDDINRLRRLGRSLQVSLEATVAVTTNDTEYTHSPSSLRPQISRIALGQALHRLMEEHDVFDYADRVQLGSSLMRLQDLDDTVVGDYHPHRIFCTPLTTAVHTSTASHHIIKAIDGYLGLLSPETPTTLTRFALSALTSIVRTAERATSVGIVAPIADSLLTPTCAARLLILPRTSPDVQTSVAALVNALAHVAPRSSSPVPQDVYELWMKMIRVWLMPSSLPTLQLLGANSLRSISSHPRSRQFLHDSPETMNGLFELARHLHQEVLELPRPATRRLFRSGLKNHFPFPDQFQRLLIQKHLARAFRNVCVSYRSGDAILPKNSSAAAALVSTRTLPMSKAFAGTHDVMDLPLIGVDEFDASTEFGWIDILTQWTSSPDRSVRQDAIDSLVHLVEHDDPAGPREHILQAWLMSMLQHVRNLTGGDILAVKEVEEIAKLTDDLTPGNEKVLFNPAVVDAGASALAILAEQHHEELIRFGVVPLVSLLATRCSSGQVNFFTQSARVIANIAASCCTSLDQLSNVARLELARSSASTSSHVNSWMGAKGWDGSLGHFYDVGHLLRQYPCGIEFLRLMEQWATLVDPFERSQRFRVLSNMRAYQEKIQLGTHTFPVYAEGVHPIVAENAEDLFDCHANDSSMNHVDVDVDVVFVHGLRGHPFGTWRTDMNDAIDARNDIWPDVLLYEDLRKRGISPRLLTLGYEAEMMSWSSPWPSLTLQERAKVMLRALNHAHVGMENGGSSRRPVIFVTHSMGGLLVKKMLLLSVADHDCVDDTTLATSTKGVVFLAVPHFGSDLARGVRSESVRALLRTHPALQDLCSSHDRRLETLNDAYQELGIDSLSIAEALPAPLGFGLSAMVVKPESANPGIGEFFVLPDSDHMTICKAKSRSDRMYQSVPDYIARHVPKEPIRAGGPQ